MPASHGAAFSFVKITEHPSLLALNTFGVAANARLMVEVENEEDVLEMPVFNSKRDFVLGGGSNVLFVSSVPGIVFLNRIGGIAVIEQTEHQTLIEVGAGVNWHGLVTWSMQQGLSGLENLALIPGLAGAAPIQNIGAYGVELSSVLASVTAWDWQTATWAILNNKQCCFSYRDSVFKSTHSERYFITSIRLNLQKIFTPQLHYAGLEAELFAAGVSDPTAIDVYSAVIRLRQRKLPDPTVDGNAGSFFKNPVVSMHRLESLRTRFPALPAWAMCENKVKIPAAWMIEQCGLKGYESNGAAISGRHALVIQNQERASGLAIWQLARHVQDVVQQQFGIILEPEPKIYQQENLP